MMPETLGCLLAVGNVAEIFEYGSKVAKIYRSATGKPAAFREAAIHATIEAMGLPVPAIWGVRAIEDRWAIVFDRVHLPSFADQMRANPDETSNFLECMVRLQLQIHSGTTSLLVSLKPRLASNIVKAEFIDETHKQALLAGLTAMPDGDCLCHGDFHPFNILGDAAAPVVIDWADASRGPALADVCRSYLLLLLHAEVLATPYLDTYCRMSGIAAGAALAWMPYVAAARLAEHVPDERLQLLQVLAPMSDLDRTS